MHACQIIYTISIAIHQSRNKTHSTMMRVTPVIMDNTTGKINDTFALLGISCFAIKRYIRIYIASSNN